MSLSFSYSSKASTTIPRVASSQLASICNNGRRTSSTRNLRELRTQQNGRLIYVIDIFRNNGRIVELLTYHGEPLQHILVNVMIVPGLIEFGSM
jgi:hypothetical protein